MYNLFLTDTNPSAPYQCKYTCKLLVSAYKSDVPCVSSLFLTCRLWC